MRQTRSRTKAQNIPKDVLELEVCVSTNVPIKVHHKYEKYNKTNILFIHTHIFMLGFTIKTTLLC